MAATELTPSARRLRSTVTVAFVNAYTAIWAATVGSTALVALGGPTLRAWVRRVLELTLTPKTQAGGVTHALSLAGHNIPIAGWPLLLGVLGVAGRARIRRLLDVLVLACLLANCVPVGAALGAYGTRLLPFLPQLPLEWAGLAVGYGSWILQRDAPISSTRRVQLAAAIVICMAVAAGVETYATPRAHETSRVAVERSGAQWTDV